MCLLRYICEVHESFHLTFLTHSSLNIIAFLKLYVVKGKIICGVVTVPSVSPGGLEAYSMESVVDVM